MDKANTRKNITEAGTVYYNNIWEVSYLLYKKIPFIETVHLNGKVTFIFSDKLEVQQAIQEFILNPEVRIQEYISIFQRVKNLIYQVKG